MGKSTVGDIYRCTDRIPIIDSLFEIPIAFAKQTLSTVVLWTMLAIASVAMYFVFHEYEERQSESKNN
eukprot:6984668-Ditylum_brightwellii.AAC.1